MQYVTRGQSKRGKRQARQVQRVRIRWRTAIHVRPAVIQNPNEFGHWADTVLGAHATGGLHINVEQRFWKLSAIKIESITSRATPDAPLTIFASLLACAERDVTADNGSEFACHSTLAGTLTFPTSFADTYSAYQRSTNEHSTVVSAIGSPNAPASRSLPRQCWTTDITDDKNRPSKILG
jgi:IS30 family transposase